MRRGLPGRAPARVAVLIAAMLASGCGPDARVAPLREEITRLEQERVEPIAVERARDEAESATRDVVVARSELAALRLRLDELVATRDRLAVERAQAEAGVAAARAATTAARQRIEETASRGRALDAELARVRGRAALVREQLSVLARELRDDDPAWATERRRRTLAETLQRAARTWPDDPWLVALAAAPRDEADGAARARDDARRVIAHLETVYELERSAGETRAPR